ICPDPLQVGQVLISDALLAPRPPQTGHGQLCSIVTSFSQPAAISSRVNFTLVRLSRPRVALGPLCCSPKPPNPPKPPKPPNAPPKRLLSMSFRLPNPWLQS